jgi:hypothetical protein
MSPFIHKYLEKNHAESINFSSSTMFSYILVAWVTKYSCSITSPGGELPDDAFKWFAGNLGRKWLIKKGKVYFTLPQQFTISISPSKQKMARFTPQIFQVGAM